MNDSSLARPAARRARLLFVLLVGVAASRADIQLVGGMTRESVVTLGGRSEGRILLRNTGTQDQDVRVYQTDYRFWSDGRNEYGEPGSTPRSNARWVTVTPNQVTVPAGGTETVFYTITVPEDQQLRGTYWSLLMVEPLAPAALQPAPGAADEIKVGVQTVVRYGIQMVTQLGNTGQRGLRITDRRLVAGEDGQRVLQVDFENTGERVLIPQVWVEIYDAQGANLGRFEGAKLRIYPGCSVRQSMNLTQLPAGRYKALVLADNGDENVYGGQYDLELP